MGSYRERLETKWASLIFFGTTADLFKDVLPIAPISSRQTAADLEVRTMNFLRDMHLRMIIVDEVHNLLVGSYREQRRFLNALRYLTNELEASLGCFGVNEAADAIRGDEQLSRRMDEHHLPLWAEGQEFSQLIQTLMRVFACGMKPMRRLRRAVSSP